MNRYHTFWLLVIISSLFSCKDEKSTSRIFPEDSSQYQILEEIPAAESGIHFSNTITEDASVNAITFDGMLQGAGVGVLDANNDGLMDVFFASNMTGDKLYINKGDFKFEDQTIKAGIKNMNWSTGIAVVDINADGWDDIYVCKFLYDEDGKRANLFYINNGDGTFSERAKEMGLDDTGFGIMANFFDYDNDGDLDMYLANQPPNSLTGKSQLKGKLNYRYTDKLYRNDGNKFEDVTDFAGIKNYSYSLSATTFDFNKDGYKDIYVACDYDEPDYLYLNQGNGTFKNVAHEALKHMSNFSMGVDIADVNNDGHLDVYVADMVAEDNFRQKTNMSGMNPERFYALANAGYHYQYMFNALHLNNGDNSFSEIAQLSGISNTDWSWTPLFIDFDQDGYKDLIVTNGLIKEMRNKDFENWRKDFFKKKMEEAEQSQDKQLYINPMEISKRAPSFKIPNFMYRNNGDLSFTKLSKEWGFDQPSWSQGAAYADFDNDGDLDLIINNMNMPAGLYRNTANEKGLNNYLLVSLKGSDANPKAIGSTIILKYANEEQIYEYSPYRGYMSSSQTVAHFGTGDIDRIQELTVVWPDGRESKMTDVAANQVLEIKYSSAGAKHNFNNGQKLLFQSMGETDIAHVENEFNDFKREILLPYKTSTLGPSLAKADVNGDGLEDFYLGGSAGFSGTLVINKGKGAFEKRDNGFSKDAAFEDNGAHFFDFDNDGDMDLYVCSGGNEYATGRGAYRDRLYINDGQGNFSKSQALPAFDVSTAAVVSLDMDSDGDLDLFVGGRQKPGEYGKPVSSFLLENNNGKFTDVTDTKAAELFEFGMVTDAVAADLNGDENLELIVVGEWLGITVFEVSEKGLVNRSDEYGLSNTKGWWNTIAIDDLDGDGDSDLVVGNLGLNLKYKASVDKPFKLYVDDFDKNGTNDVYLGFYEGESCFPVRGRQCSSEQMPFVKKKFKNYNEFGTATITDVLEGRISEQTVIQEVHTFANSVFINDSGRFRQVELPNEAQISPVYGIAIDDFDKDGRKDIFLAGNMYNREVETTRSDAGKGCLVRMDASGSFTVDRTTKTGVSADKDVRDLAVLNSGSSKLLVIANNNDPIQLYSY